MELVKYSPIPSSHRNGYKRFERTIWDLERLSHGVRDHLES